MEYYYSWRVGYKHLVGLPCPLPVYEYITDQEQSTLCKLHINSLAHNNAEPAKVPAELVAPTIQPIAPVITTKRRINNQSQNLQLELF